MMNSQQEADLIEAFGKARKNLVAFRRILLNVGEDEVAPAWFHYEWSELLLHSKKSTAIEGFRESAKSQYVLRAFPLYSLLFPSKDRDYIVIVKNNATLARNKLKEIQAEYNTNPAVQASLVKIREESGDVFSVDVKNDEGEVISKRRDAGT